MDDANNKNIILSDQTLLERVSGSTLTGMAASAIAAMVGGPLAAMLPILAGSLAAGRRRERVEEALRALATTLQENAAAVQRLSDEQFRVVSEIIETTVSTAQEAKLEYLKRAARRVVGGTQITPHEAEWISRVIRDISADEVTFLLENREFTAVAFANEPTNIPGLRAVLDGEPELAAASGLIGLGILIPGKNTVLDIGTYRFNPLVDRLIRLFDDEEAES